MQTDQIALIALRLVLLAPAIILHEVAHGYVAYLLGDPTAKTRGRLTLNPVAHFDLWGTLIMPIMLLVVTQGAFAFGYAKPVPINPYLMRKTTVQTGMLLTGIAGPVTNIGLAVITGLAYRVTALAPGVPDIVLEILYFFAYINLILAFFNLIPIPPLDGSKVLFAFLNPRTAWQVRPVLEQYGFIILIAAMLLPIFGGQTLIGIVFRELLIPLQRLLVGG